MKCLSLLGILTALHQSIVECGTLKENLCPWLYEKEQRCISDGSGYIEYICTKIDSETDIIKAWVAGKETICKKPKSKCRCYNNRFVEQECQCINPRERPRWPPVGVLHWNGTYYYDNNWWHGHENPRVAFLPGEIHKNGNGGYMKKWTKVFRWPDKGPAELKVEFELIVPSDGGKTFTEYRGNGGDRNCSKKYGVQEGSFNTLWKLPRFVNGYTLLNETKKERSITTQTWSTVLIGDDWKKYWEWKMDYHIKKDYAIPTSYIFQIEDGFGGEYDDETYTYTFEELHKNDQSFHLADYCDNA